MPVSAAAASTWGAGAAIVPETVTAFEPDPPAIWQEPQPATPAVAETFDVAAVTYEPPVDVIQAPAAASDPALKVIAEETINDAAVNRVNVALFHIQRLQQLVPDITGWSEDQAAAVNKAIRALDTSLKGREDASDPYHGLRETVKAAKEQNRDIDVMIALTDRAAEIEDLLKAHDAYSKAVREALYAIKPAAVNYVVSVKRRAAARRPSTKRTTRTTTTPAPAKK